MLPSTKLQILTMKYRNDLLPFLGAGQESTSQAEATPFTAGPRRSRQDNGQQDDKE